MKKPLKYFFLFSLLVLFSLAALSFSGNIVYSKEDALKIVEDKLSVSQSAHDGNPWNENTKISGCYVLHGLDNKVKGYVFPLTTNGAPAGYFQVLGQKVSSSHFGFDPITALMEDLGVSTTESVRFYLEDRYYLEMSNGALASTYRDSSGKLIPSTERPEDVLQRLKNRAVKQTIFSILRVVYILAAVTAFLLPVVFFFRRKPISQKQGILLSILLVVGLSMLLFIPAAITGIWN